MYIEVNLQYIARDRTLMYINVNTPIEVFYNYRIPLITHTGLTIQAVQDVVSVGVYFPVLWMCHSCWHSGQRLFCFTHSDIQQL